MSKRVIKNRNKKCHQCKSEAGLLLITLPSNVFRRKRTAAEEKAFQQKVESKNLTLADVKEDQRTRKIRLCPKCIKPLSVKYGDTPVQNWGQKS